jgi:hypothetical protein
MLLSAGLASLVVLATGVVADPSLAIARDSLIRVPISKHINFKGIPDFTKRDRDHLRNLVKRCGHRHQSPTVNKTPNIPLDNIGGIYVATIGVGDLSPKTDSSLILGAPPPGWERITIMLKPRAV